MEGLDKQSKQQLLEDLKQTESSLWPAMIQQFRAALAYRRQLEQRERVVAQARHESEIAADNAVSLPSVDGHVGGTLENVAARGALVPPAATQVSHDVVPSGTPDGGLRVAAPGARTESVDNGSARSLATEQRVGQAAVSPSQETARRRAPVVAPVAPPEESESAPPDTLAVSRGGESDWRSHLQQAITGLERENRDVPRRTHEVGRHAALRMLYLAAGRRNDALRAIDGIPPAQQDFWSRQLYGLAEYLDDADQQDSGRRATAACRHLQEAVDKLGEMATLEVRNLEFCTEVSSFGVFKPFENKEFVAGQEVLLYAEICNFRSVPTEKGYCTALRTSYEILDARGHRVEQHEFATTEDFCQNRRRDFFMRYFIRLPDRIYEGRYTLQLTIEDVKGHKFGQSSIEFQIKDA